jgi:hypothetical protein
MAENSFHNNFREGDNSLPNKNREETLKQHLTSNINKILVRIFWIAILLVILFLAGCVSKNTEINSQTPTYTLPALTSTPVPTQTLTQIPVTPTRTINPDVGIVFTVHSTEVPPIVKTTDPENSKYLYKKALVTVTLPYPLSEVEVYFNLDDLSDNDQENSDVRISSSSGSGGIFHSLDPVNYAYFSWSRYPDLTYDDCIKYFPIKTSDSTMYIFQGLEFQKKGGAFCFLTNENRIAVVRLVDGSQIIYTDGSEELTFEVTVYSKIAENQ